MMKKVLIFSALLAMIHLTAVSQDYQTGVGVRLGLSNGITLKHFVGPATALEGLLTVRYDGFNITGLYEIHTEPFSVNNLYFYYGAGAHLGSWGNRTGKSWWDDNETHSVIGIDGIVGLEYNFLKVPFNISLDFKPAINIIGHPKLWFDEVALSIRYTWGSR